MFQILVPKPIQFHKRQKNRFKKKKLVKNQIIANITDSDSKGASRGSPYIPFSLSEISHFNEILYNSYHSQTIWHTRKEKKTRKVQKKNRRKFAKICKNDTNYRSLFDVPYQQRTLKKDVLILLKFYYDFPLEQLREEHKRAESTAWKGFPFFFVCVNYFLKETTVSLNYFQAKQGTLLYREEILLHNNFSQKLLLL